MPRETHTISVYGNGIRDKHTHYETRGHVGPTPYTLTIRGDIAEEFKKVHGRNITDKDIHFKVPVSFGRNDELVAECQDPYKLGPHFIGTLDSIDDIIILPDDITLHGRD